MQTLVHYFLHLGFPLLLAIGLFRAEWKKVYILFVLTMLIDLDHLIATPVFDPMRCSLGLHPLHSFYAIPLYFSLLFFKQTRIPAIGIILHLITDFIDCLWTFSKCDSCYLNSKIHELVLWAS